MLFRIFCSCFLINAVLSCASVSLQTGYGQEQQIDELIQQLSDDSYEVRNQATRKLIKEGRDVIEALEVVAQSNNNEANVRAFQILKKIGTGSSPEAAVEAVSALERLAMSDNRRVKTAAESVIEMVEPRIQLVVQRRLEEMGAEVQTSTYSENEQVVYSVTSVTIGEGWKGSVRDLKYIARCPRLAFLEIISDQVDKEILKSFVALEYLHTIELENADLDNSAIDVLLTASERLQTVELRYVPVDDECIEQAGKLTLDKLGLIGTRISTAGKDKLAEKFQGSDLDYRRGGFFGVRYNVGEGPCVLTEVIAGTGAEAAGLQADDQVIAFNGETVEVGGDFRAAVSKCFVGDEIEVVIKRGEEQLTLTATLGRWKM